MSFATEIIAGNFFRVMLPMGVSMRAISDLWFAEQ